MVQALLNPLHKKYFPHISRLWTGLCRIQETECSWAGSRYETWESHRNPTGDGPGGRGELQPGKMGGFSRWTATVTHGELGWMEEEEAFGTWD